MVYWILWAEGLAEEIAAPEDVLDRQVKKPSGVAAVAADLPN
jgi:hypothetical protein